MRDDSILVQQAIAGDKDAFAELYERYFDRVYDFLARMVRNQQAAADLTQDTFLRALHSLPSLKQGGSFKSWIFTIARNTALSQLERSSRQQPLDTSDDDSDEGFALDVIDGDRAGNPEEALEMEGMAGLVWEAAKALDPKQYSVLDLTVRQGLESAEIAEVLGVTKNNAYVMVNRMKKTLEEAIGALMLLKDGRRGCAELNQILVAMGMPEMSPQTRRAIDKHVAKCDVCEEKRRKMTSPFAIMGGFAAASPAIGVKARILDGIQTTFPYGTGGASGGANGGSGGDGGSNGGGSGSSASSHMAPLPDYTHGTAGRASMGGEARRGSRLPKVLVGAIAAVLLLGGGLLVATASDDAAAPATTQVVAGPTAVATAAALAVVPPTETPVEPAQAIEGPEPEVVAPIEETPEPQPAVAGPVQPPLTNPGGAPNNPPAGGGNPVSPLPPAGGGGTSPNPGTPDANVIIPPPVTPPQPPPAQPDPPPPPPQRCVATAPSAPASVSFTASETVKTVQLRATETCGLAQAFQASGGNPWVTVTPASGSLQPGGVVTLSIQVNRSTLANGNHSSRVRVTTAAGPIDIQVTAAVVKLQVAPTSTPARTGGGGQFAVPPTPTCRSSTVNC